MTCWATCCLSQRELLILHVHHICASVRLVRMEWLWRVFNEGRETPVYFRCSVESCHHCLLPDARLQMAETFDHCCSEPHLWRASSGKPGFSLFQLSLLVFTSVYLEMSVLGQLVTAVLLCVRALLYICLYIRI